MNKSQDLIISVKEARKLLGSSAKNMSDEEVENLISDLDVIAREAIRSYLHKNETQAIKDGDNSKA